MSPHDPGTIRRLARHDDGPVFDEPWQAQIMAIADALVTGGLISPSDWSARLGAELTAAETRGEEDTPETYYAAVIRTVEAVVEEGGHVTSAILQDRIGAWTRAYERTPHGQPVELISGMD